MSHDSIGIGCQAGVTRRQTVTAYLAALVAASLTIVVHAIEVSVPNVSARAGEVISVPVSLIPDAGMEVTNADIQVDYDSTLISPLGLDRAGTLSANWLGAYGAAVDGVLRVAVAGATGGTEAGTLVKLLFQVAPDAEGSTPLALSGVRVNVFQPDIVISGSVEITPATSVVEVLYGLVAGWNLLSLPGTGDASPLDAVNLTTYTWNAVGQMWRFEPSAAGALSPVSTGLFLFADTNAFVPVTVDVGDSTVRSVPVTLERGWNLVGAPSSADSTVGFPVSALTDGTTTFSTVYGYDPITMGYGLVSEMGAGSGYWVFNDTAGAATVNLTQPRDLDLGSLPSAPARPAPMWLADLRLTFREGDHRAVEIGVSDMARAGFDAFDLPLPPPPPVANYVELFVNTDHEVGRLARSVQDAGPDGMDWTVTARLPDTDGVIAWSPDLVPERWGMFIESDDEVVDMRERASLRLGQGAHLLRVRMTRMTPSTTRALPNYPNPFNPETWIPFELQAAAEVVVRIYQPGGAVVRTLNLGRQEPGYYTGRHDAAYWDGRNETGEAVGSGVYFYELAAGDYHAMRRMVILK